MFVSDLLRSGVIPTARAFTSGQRDLARTCSIPRLGSRLHSPKLALLKISVKVGCHNFKTYFCGKLSSHTTFVLTSLFPERQPTIAG